VQGKTFWYSLLCIYARLKYVRVKGMMMVMMMMMMIAMIRMIMIVVVIMMMIMMKITFG
jgi:hypothetical protein